MNEVILDIIIRADGEVEVVVEGAKGKRCLAYAELLRQIVGDEKSKQLTAEYYEPETTIQKELELDLKV
jgi:hypothetical protein